MDRRNDQEEDGGGLAIFDDLSDVLKLRRQVLSSIMNMRCLVSWFALQIDCGAMYEFFFFAIPSS